MAVSSTIASVVKLDNSGGTPVDISTYVTDAPITTPRSMYDTSTLGVTAPQFIPGLFDGDKVTLTVLYDITVMDQLFSLLPLTTTSTLEIAPEGTTTGKRRIFGECFLESISNPVKVNSVMSCQAVFQKTGAWSKTVY
jgi:hypothetical protein